MTTKTMFSGALVATPELSGPFFTPPPSTIPVQGEDMLEGVYLLAEKLPQFQKA